MADNERRLLEESFDDCVTTGPSDAPAGGNICMEDQCAGNDPVSTHTHMDPDACKSISSTQPAITSSFYY